MNGSGSSSPASSKPGTGSHAPREGLARRDFLALGGMAFAVGCAAAGTRSAPPRIPRAREDRTRGFRLACKLGMVQENLSLEGRFSLLRSLGFDGVEMDAPNTLNAAEVEEATKKTGLPVHGVVDSVHWRHCLSDPSPEVRAKGAAALKTAILDAEAYGATTVLLVPGRVTRTVRYDQVWDRSQREIAKVLPFAAEHGIAIAIENVWNGFLQSPLEFARYLDEFDSPWIGAYLDIGNMVKFGWPTHWIHALGERILKVDVKGYSRAKGFRVGILEGDCGWKEVVPALETVGYRGWLTAEVGGGDRKRLSEIRAALEKIRSFAKG